MSRIKLTRDKLVEHIRNAMPSDYSEIERIAFIEKEVAMQMSFDEKYLWGDRETKQKIYELAQKEAYKLANKHSQSSRKNGALHQKQKLICVTIAEQFVYVAKKLGLNAKFQRRMVGMGIETGESEIFKKLSSEYQDHVCPIVELSNGNGIEIDIQDDLFALQSRSKPKNFGTQRHGTRTENDIKIEILDQSLVERTFRKVYQLGENEIFTDEYIMTFAAGFISKRNTPIEILEAFLADKRIQEELQNMGCVEASKLYKRILNVCYDEIDEREFYARKRTHKAIIDECVLSDREGTKRYSFCIYAEDDTQKVFYIYSKKSRTMVKLTPEEICQMKREPMKVMLRPRGTKFQPQLRTQIISYINSADPNATNLQANDSQISVEDIFLEDDELQ